jgi:hypothetical protein
MKEEKVADRDGKARRIRNVIEAHQHIDEKYVITVYSGNEITRYGHLVVAGLQPKDSESLLPTFEFRWDEGSNALDVDARRVSKADLAEFRRGTGQYYGHHTRRVNASSRVFEADIGWKGQRVYMGQIGFALDREAAAVVKIGVKVGATDTMTYSVKGAAGALGMSVQHVRHLLAKGMIAGKKLGRDWMVLSLDYERRRAPKRKKGESNKKRSARVK